MSEQLDSIRSDLQRATTFVKIGVVSGFLALAAEAGRELLVPTIHFYGTGVKTLLAAAAVGSPPGLLFVVFGVLTAGLLVAGGIGVAYEIRAVRTARRLGVSLEY